MSALAGQRIVLTGAAQGLGRAVATALAAEGARLVLMDRDAAGLATLALPGEHQTLAVDLGGSGAVTTSTTGIANNVLGEIHHRGLGRMPQRKWLGLTTEESRKLMRLVKKTAKGSLILSESRATIKKRG